MDKIQLNEEQARQLYRDGTQGYYPSVGAENNFIDKIKQKGHIKQSKLEIAEINYWACIKDGFADYKIFAQIFITELKKELERFKGVKNG